MSKAILLSIVIASVQAAAPAAAAAAQQREPHMVAELELQSGGDKVTKEALTKVFTDLGATPDKFNPVIEKHASGADEKVLVTAGDKATCESVAQKFVALGMKCSVRALTHDDVPSEYDGSDVIPAGQEKLREVLAAADADGQGVLVAFTAPWCGACKSLTPALKEAATQLKASGVRVVSVNTQASPALAQALGVKMLPTIKWMQNVGENMAIADYQGAREAAALARFAENAGAAIAEQVANQPAAASTKEGLAEASKEGAKVATAEADATAAKGSKMGQSKLGKSSVDGPESTESKLSASKAKGSDVAPPADGAKQPAAEAGVQKAATPA